VSSSTSPFQDSSGDDAVALTEEQLVQALRSGQIEEKGLLPYSSNTSFLVLVHTAELALPAVYKPQRGENPLWDFEWGTLCCREAAAYVVSSALGWRLVPPTLLRDASRGLGSVQFYIHHDPDIHYFTIQSDARFAETLRQLALFDFVVNNADRKSGHCLIDTQQRLWAIDHGICFHTEYKLRSVIWEFSGEPIEDDYLTDLMRLRRQLDDLNDSLTGTLGSLLGKPERTAMASRIDQLLRKQCYPAPHPHRRNYPWPPV
jgi:hypothetical protein